MLLIKNNKNTKKNNNYECECLIYGIYDEDTQEMTGSSVWYLIIGHKMDVLKANLHYLNALDV